MVKRNFEAGCFELTGTVLAVGDRYRPVVATFDTQSGRLIRTFTWELPSATPKRPVISSLLMTDAHLYASSPAAQCVVRFDLDSDGYTLLDVPTVPGRLLAAGREIWLLPHEQSTTSASDGSERTLRRRLEWPTDGTVSEDQVLKVHVSMPRLGGVARDARTYGELRALYGDTHEEPGAPVISILDADRFVAVRDDVRLHWMYSHATLGDRLILMCRLPDDPDHVVVEGGEIRLEVRSRSLALMDRLGGAARIGRFTKPSCAKVVTGADGHPWFLSGRPFEGACTAQRIEGDGSLSPPLALADPQNVHAITEDNWVYVTVGYPALWSQDAESIDHMQNLIQVTFRSRHDDVTDRSVNSVGVPLPFRNYRKWTQLDPVTGALWVQGLGLSSSSLSRISSDGHVEPFPTSCDLTGIYTATPETIGAEQYERDSLDRFQVAFPDAMRNTVHYLGGDPWGLSIEGVELSGVFPDTELVLTFRTEVSHPSVLFGRRIRLYDDLGKCFVDEQFWDELESFVNSLYVPIGRGGIESGPVELSADEDGVVWI